MVMGASGRRGIMLGLLLAAASATSALGASDPIRTIRREPVPVFPGVGITPAYQLRAGAEGTAATPADLAFDAATEVGPGVRRVLDEVGDDPLAAYRWVRDKVEFEPYRGVKRGAEGVAWERTGNDFDQAALLAALLRTQGVPVRFVYGVVRVDGDTLADWAAMATPELAFKLFVQGGVPITGIRIAGEIAVADVNHCWIEARLPYTNPGARGPGEPVWIPLDPSFKGHDVEPGQDIYPRLGFQEEDFLLDYIALDGDPSPEDHLRDVMRDKLAEIGGGGSLGQGAYDIAVRPGGDAALPLAMPPGLEVRGVIWEQAVVPETYHYRIRLTIWDGQNDAAGVGPGDVSVTFRSAALTGHFLALVYRPATPEDQALVDSTESGSVYDPAIRDRVRLVPVLLVDGQPVSGFLPGDHTQAAPPVSPFSTGNIGVRQTMLVETLFPGIAPGEPVAESDTRERELVVGEVYALGWSVGTVTASRMKNLADSLRDLQPVGTANEVLVSTLSLTALQYLHRMSVSTEFLARLLGVRSLHEPSLMLCGIKLDVAAGGFDSAGLFFDVQQYWMSMVSRDGRADRERAFMFVNGMQSSYLEHRVLEEIFVTTAVSTMKILRRYREVGHEPLVLDASNLEPALDGLALGDWDKETIRQKVMQEGYRVVLPAGPVSIERWVGWGYVLWDPDRGFGRFGISGGLSGGHIAAGDPYFVLSLWLQDYGQMDYTIIYSWYVDPELSEPIFQVVFYNGRIDEPFIASVLILPKNYGYQDPTYTDPWVFETVYGSTYPDAAEEKFLPATFYVDGPSEFEAIALLILPGALDDPVRQMTLHPMRIAPVSPLSQSEPLNERHPLGVQTHGFGWELAGGARVARQENVNPFEHDGRPAVAGDVLDLRVSQRLWVPTTARIRIRSMHAAENDDLIWDLAVDPKYIGTEQTTTISYALVEDAMVTVRVLDVDGEPVWTLAPGGISEAGFYDVPYSPVGAGGGFFKVAVSARPAFSSGEWDEDQVPLRVAGGCQTLPITQHRFTPDPTFAPVGTVARYTLESARTGVTVRIEHGATGKVLATQDAGGGDHALAWNGLTEDGPAVGLVPLVLSAQDGSCRQQILDIVTFYPGAPTMGDLVNGLELVPDNILGLGARERINVELASGLLHLQLNLVDAAGTTWPLLYADTNSPGWSPHYVDIPLEAAAGKGAIQAVAFQDDGAGRVVSWGTMSVVALLIDGLQTSSGAPNLMPLGPLSAGGDTVLWPGWASIGLPGGEVVDAVKLELFTSGSSTLLRTVVFGPEDGQFRDQDGKPLYLEVLDDSRLWRVRGFPFPDVDQLDGGWYTLRVTVLGDGGSRLWRGDFPAMIGDSPISNADDSPLRLKGDPDPDDLPDGETSKYQPPWLSGWLFAPKGQVQGVGGDKRSPALALTSSKALRLGFQIMQGDGLVKRERVPSSRNFPYRIYQTVADEPIDEDEVEFRSGETVEVGAGDQFWFWNGRVFDEGGKVLGDADGTPGIYGVLAVASNGEYINYPAGVARVDGSAGSLEAADDAEIKPRSIRIVPSANTTNGVENYNPPMILFDLNVAGDVQLYIVDDNGRTVRTLFKDADGGPETRPHGAGRHLISWDLYSDPLVVGDESGYIVPEGSYRLKVQVKPFQGGGGPISQILSPRLNVLFDTERFHDIGKARGKAFYGGVDAQSGNRFLQVTDISLPLNRHGFKWVRYYNSMGTGGGPLGVGWRHHYMVQLTAYHGGSRRLVWGHGGSELFTYDSGTYTPATHSLNKLFKTGAGWRLETPEGNFSFDADGFLTVAAPWELSFSYVVMQDEKGDDVKRLSDITGTGDLATLVFNISYGGTRISSVSASRSGDPATAQSVNYTSWGEKRENDVNSDKAYYLAEASGRFGEFSYRYTDQVESTSKIKDNDDNLVDGHRFHYAMTSSDDPFMGETEYVYEHISDVYPHPDPGEPDTVVGSHRVKSVDHRGGGDSGWAARGRTSYHFEKFPQSLRQQCGPDADDTVCIESPLGYEIVEYDPDDNTVIRRDDARPEAYVTYMEWDGRNRLLKQTDGAGVATYYDYYNAGEQGPGGAYAMDTEQVERQFLGSAPADASLGLGLSRNTYDGAGNLETATTYLDAGATVPLTTSYTYEYGFDLRGQGFTKAGLGTGTVVGTRIAVRDPDGFVTVRFLDSEGRQVREIVDPTGLRLVTDMTYDVRGNLKTRTDPRGHVTTYEHDRWDRVRKEKAAFTQEGSTFTHERTYTYDGVGNRVTATDNSPAGVTTTYEYDGGSRLVRETDHFGKVVRELDRDPAVPVDPRPTGWVYRSTDLQGSATSFTYYPNGWAMAEERSPDLGTTVYRTEFRRYDGRGNLLEKVDARDKLWRYGYDAAGRMTRSTDPTNRRTGYDYYDDGDRRRTFTILPDDREVTEAEYETNEAGWVVREGKGYAGTTLWTRYLYDERGNRRYSVDPLDNVTEFVYDDTNLLRREVDPFGQAQRVLTYYESGSSHAGLAKHQTDYYGRTSRFVYDGRHRLLERWDPHHIPTVYGYDELARVTSETRAGIRLDYRYDGGDNRTRVTDGDGRQRRFIHDDAGRLETEYVVLDGRSNYYRTDAGLPVAGMKLRSLTYDDRGRLWTEADADGFVTTYAYYDNGWVERKALHDGSYERYEYNPAGVRERVYRTNGAGVEQPTVFVLDLDAADGVRGLQVLQANHPDQRTERFTWTAANELRSRTSRENVTEWFEYDSRHRQITRWMEATSPLLPVDAKVDDTIPVGGTAPGVRLAERSYNAAGDVLCEANSSQIAAREGTPGAPSCRDFAAAVAADAPACASLAAQLGGGGWGTASCYTGTASSPDNAVAVLLDRRVDPVGRESRYAYVVDGLGKVTDRPQLEAVLLPAGSAYTSRPGTISLDPGGETALRLAEYGYDNAGNVLTVKDGDNRVVGYAYDELGRKKAEWRPTAGESLANPVRTVAYDGRGNVVSEIIHGINDAESAETRNEYADPRGSKTRTVYYDDRYETWDYDLAGSLLRHRDPDGRVTRRDYDQYDRPLREVRILDGDTRYVPGAMAAAYDDALGTESGVTVALNSYDANGDVEWTQDGRGVRTDLTYDAYHRPLTKSVLGVSAELPAPCLTRDWCYEYDALGKAAVTTDPNRHVTATEYDGEGRERRSLRVLDDPTSYAATAGADIHGRGGLLFSQVEYDAAGRKVREVDGRGIERAAVFDVLDRVREQSRAGIRTATFEYEAGGNKLYWKDGEGNERRYLYDLRGYLSTETGYPHGSPVIVRTTTHDRQGNLRTEKDAGSPLQNEVRYTYDRRGNQAARTVVAPTGNQTTASVYDGSGNKVSEKTPLQHETTWEYDEFALVDTVTAPDGGETRYAYDPVGNLLRIEDAEYNGGADGHFSTFEYDDLGRRTRADRFRAAGDAIVERAGYDGAGNPLWKEDGAGRRVTYAYDEFDRVRSEIRDLPADAIAGKAYLDRIATTYDANGNVDVTIETFRTAGGGTTARAVDRGYDDFDRIISEVDDRFTLADPGDDLALGWTYDADGRRESLTYPGGRSLTYGYDGLGNLEQMIDSDGGTDRVTDYERYPNGLVHFLRHPVAGPGRVEEEWRYKSGTKETEFLAIKDATGTEIRHVTYEYDADGNRVKEDDLRPGEGDIHRVNSYDAAGRLLTVAEGSPVTRTTVYTYDLLGNRETEVVADTADFANNANLDPVYNGAGEIVSIGGTKGGGPYEATFQYDAAGNLVARTETGSADRSMDYDNAGRMVSVADAATGELGFYLYNAEGRRIETAEATICRAYVYDGRSLLDEHVVGCGDHVLGPSQRRYLYADRLTGLGTASGEYAVHLDPLGSTLEVTDFTGLRFNSNAYDPLGEVDTTKDGQPVGSISKLLYTGHQQDEATGLIYFGARYYDPALGRFLRPDPYFGELTTPPSLHKYMYAHANPYRFVDLEGNAALAWDNDVRTYEHLRKLGFVVEDETGSFVMPEDQQKREELIKNIEEQRSIAEQMYTTDSTEYRGWNKLFTLVTASEENEVYLSSNRHVKVNIKMSNRSDYPSLYPVVARLDTERERNWDALHRGFARHGLNIDGYFDIPIVPLVSSDIDRIERTVELQTTHGTRVPNRRPDFNSFSISVPMPKTSGWISWTISANLDRYGNLYWSIVGPGVGRTTRYPVAVTFTANWLMDGENYFRFQREMPSEEQLSDFLSRHGISMVAGYYGGVNIIVSPGNGVATGIGFVTPQVGGNYSYSWKYP